MVGSENMTAADNDQNKKKSEDLSYMDDKKANNEEEERESEEQEEAVKAKEEVSGEAKSNEDESFKSKYYYLAAELENLKKRGQKEKENLLKFGNEKILTDLLDILDNFDRTLAAIDQEEDKKIKNIAVGIEMVKNMFYSVLEKYGLVSVKTTGEIFDPNFHEAISQRVVKGKKEDEIIEVYQKGYLLNGRLLRPAKVITAKLEE